MLTELRRCLRVFNTRIGPPLMLAFPVVSLPGEGRQRRPGSKTWRLTVLAEGVSCRTVGSLSHFFLRQETMKGRQVRLWCLCLWGVLAASVHLFCFGCSFPTCFPARRRQKPNVMFFFFFIHTDNNDGGLKSFCLSPGMAGCGASLDQEREKKPSNTFYIFNSFNISCRYLMDLLSKWWAVAFNVTNRGHIHMQTPVQMSSMMEIQPTHCKHNGCCSQQKQENGASGVNTTRSAEPISVSLKSRFFTESAATDSVILPLWCCREITFSSFF